MFKFQCFESGERLRNTFKNRKAVKFCDEKFQKSMARGIVEWLRDVFNSYLLPFILHLN